MPRHRPARQHGAVALIVVSMLFLAMALAALFTSRSLLVEQRSATNQIRAAQAFEAAEAGLEWGLVQLGSNRRIDGGCEPTTDVAADSFRDRYLEVSTRTGILVPRFRDDALTTSPTATTSRTSPLQAACMHTSNGWSCSCPSHGPVAFRVPADADPTTSFVIRLETVAGQPGIVRLGATGCTGAPSVCLAAEPPTHQAIARLSVAAGLIGGLRTLPSATATLRGRFDAGPAAIGLHNPDPLTGVVVRAGDEVIASAGRVTVPAGASAAGAVVARDPTLAGTDPARFFSIAFGLEKRAWRRQPAVIRIDCPLDCSAALGAAIDAAPDSALIHVGGDLHLHGPLEIGSALRPVAIVVDGVARFEGAIRLTGLLYAAALQWNGSSNGSPTGAGIRGALMLESDYRGDAAPDLVHDALVLDRLRTQAGSFARVPGSWRDF